jgi:hypothetical protein
MNAVLEQAEQPITWMVKEKKETGYMYGTIDCRFLGIETSYVTQNIYVQTLNYVTEFI